MKLSTGLTFTFSCPPIVRHLFLLIFSLQIASERRRMSLTVGFLPGSRSLADSFSAFSRGDSRRILFVSKAVCKRGMSLSLSDIFALSYFYSTICLFTLLELFTLRSTEMPLLYRNQFQFGLYFLRTSIRMNGLVIRENILQIQRNFGFRLLL